MTGRKAEVWFGFASFFDGSFELIVENEKGEQTTLHGRIRPGQLEEVDRILPTCVMVKGEPLSTRAQEEAQRG
jgi:hypothetical protein